MVRVKEVVSLLSVLLLGLSLVSCGGAGVVQASSSGASGQASLGCNQPTVFRGVDDGSQSFAVEILCSAANIPTTGGTTVLAEGTYQIQNAIAVSEITTWIGTSQNSVEETAGEITLEVPTGIAGVYKTVAIITNQKDKHQDVEGERIEHFSNGVYHLPAGSRIHFYMNMGVINPATNCPLGCAVQLNVYMNTPAV
jgi:hypothetical protein